MGEFYFWSACVAFGLLSFGWAISVIIRRADMIDPCWGLGFAAIAATLTLTGESVSLLPAILTFVWGMRLFVHLIIRWWGEEHEDRRYAAMREKGNDRWWLQSLATVFWLQAAIMWALSIPIQQAIASSLQPDLPFVLVGVTLWAVGLFFEAVGDFQLARFRAQPDSSGRVLNTGLWRYTRHPNYFGDFLVWWGLYFVSLAYGASWLTVYAPLVMSVLLMKFSGVGLLEKDISQRRPEYQTYCKTTSTFFPWFPRTSDTSGLTQAVVHRESMVDSKSR